MKRRTFAVLTVVLVLLLAIAAYKGYAADRDRAAAERVHFKASQARFARDEAALEHEVAVLCASAKANRQVIIDIIDAPSPFPLAQVDTSKLADRQLAAIIDLLVSQAHAGTSPYLKIARRPIPCATP